MSILKKINDRFYFLADNKEDLKIVPMNFDKVNGNYYTPSVQDALTLKRYAHGETLDFLIAYEKQAKENLEGSYGEEPLPCLPYCKSVYKYQARGIQEGLIRLKLYGAFLLADVPGLGKTIQAAKIIQCMESYLTKEIKVLYIVPSLLKINTKEELLNWCTYTYLDSDVQIIDSLSDKLDLKAKVYVISYQAVCGEFISNQLHKMHLDLLICDESHYLKTSAKTKRIGADIKANRTLHVQRLADKIPYKMLMTGTPLVNSPVELYSQLKILGQTGILGRYKDYWAYTNRYCDVKTDYLGHRHVKGSANEAELNKILRQTIMVRREKGGNILTELPPKHYKIVYLDNTAISTSISARLTDIHLRKQIKPKFLWKEDAEILKLRQELALDRVDQVVEYVKELRTIYPKVGVFAYHRSVISKLKEGLEHLYPVTLYGGMTPKAKDLAVKNFQNPLGGSVFIGQIQAAGVGITLTSSSVVLFAENSWVPGEIEQVTDRFHRIGQGEEVQIIFLTTPNSYEEQMLRTAIGKQVNINKVLK